MLSLLEHGHGEKVHLLRNEKGITMKTIHNHRAKAWGRAVCTLLLAVLSVAAGAANRALRQGKLPNGLTYYIYNDGSTPGEAQFYLYQNVGAVLEKNDEIGLAHVLEHLAFNATDHFPQGVMTWLRKNNLSDFEAYTGLDDTRYAVHNVPVDRPEVLDQMFLLLKDWCHGIKIQPADVEKERGIILEEWRRREGIDRRLTDSIARVVYNGSLYAQRNVIGSEQRLHAFTAKDVRRFYDKWYRPRLQFVAVIGDVDLDATENKLKQVLSTLPDKPTPYDAEARRIAPNAQPLYMRFVDRENTAPSFGLYQRKEVRNEVSTDERTRRFLFAQMFNKLAPRRFARLKNADKEAFIAASVSYSPLVRDNNQVAFDVVPYAQQAEEALQQMLSVRAALGKEGFGRQEFEAQKAEMYKGMKEALEAKGLGTPDNVMDLCRQNFLYGTPITDFREQIQHNLEVLVELEVEDINAWMHSLLDDNNLAFVTYSRTPDEMNITQSAFLAALAAAKQMKQASEPQMETLARLDLSTLVPGKITAEKDLKKLGTKEWLLSNGARVLYKYLPEAKGRIFFAGSSEGGRSAVAPQDVADYTAMRALLMQTGVANYNRNQLASWLQGKDFELSLSPGDYSNGIGGNTSVADADAFFGYLHLVLARQNFSKSVFEKYVQRSKYLYRNRNLTGMEAVQDSIRRLLFPASAANPEQDEAFFDAMRYERLSEMFNRHYGNAAHFTYCLVGDVPEAQARQWVTRYIASLKGDARVPKPKAVPMNFASKEREISRTFTAELDGDMAEIELSYTHTLRLTDKEQAAFEVLRALLENRYFEELREKRHATYTVGVKADYTSQPAPSETLSLHLSTSRQQADEVLALVHQILDDVRQGRFSQDEFKAAVVPLAVDEQTPPGNDSAANPQLWMGLLNVYAESGEMITPAESAAVEPVFSTLTPADIKAVAAKVLETAAKREIIVKSLPPSGKLS